MNGGFLVTKIKRHGDRIFERILSKKGIDAFNGAQGRILYALWQEDGVSIKTVSEKCGLAITSLTTMLERMEEKNLLIRKGCPKDKRKCLLFLTDYANSLKNEYDEISEKMTKISFEGISEDERLTFEKISPYWLMGEIFLWIYGLYESQ